VFHAIVSIKNDGHYFPGTGARCTDGLNVTLTHIEWLLKQGRQLGVSAKLISKLNYLWRSCTGELTEQNDLFRLNYALETAKDMSWNYRFLSDREWSGRNAVALSAGVNGIYLLRANLDVAFDDSGRQINPLTGNVAGGSCLIAAAGTHRLNLMPPCPTSLR